VTVVVEIGSRRAACFKLDKVIPPQLEAAARSGMRTRGAGLRQFRGMGSEWFVLNVDLDGIRDPTRPLAGVSTAV
jgi:hypothetical protein